MRVLFSSFYILMLLLFTQCMGTHKEDNTALVKKHCDAVWDSLDIADKEILLNEFIKDKKPFLTDRQSFELGNSWDAAIKSSVKYPSTITINDSSRKLFLLSESNASIDNAEKGEIIYFEKFTSENKLSQKVKSTAYITVQYRAGCKGVRVVDFKIL